jgi:hypothetical protein
MAKNHIVSEQTLRDLLEAHASLSAWYYELWEALRRANGIAHAPDDTKRAAFAERLAADFPELGAIARTIEVPRMFVPPPPAYARNRDSVPDEQATLIEPAPARLRGEGPPLAPDPETARPTEPGLAPPPFVDPDKVKYST